MRAVTAICILSLSGLFVPCEKIKIPYIDNIILRGFTGDCPSDNKSGFAMELSEMKIVLETCTDATFAFLDEFGKGTDVRAALGLSAAILEKLSQIQCKGMFATHLHGLLNLDNVNFGNLSYMKMEVEDEQKPNWKISDGNLF